MEWQEVQKAISLVAAKKILTPPSAAAPARKISTGISNFSSNSLLK